MEADETDAVVAVKLFGFLVEAVVNTGLDVKGHAVGLDNILVGVSVELNGMFTPGQSSAHYRFDKRW